MVRIRREHAPVSEMLLEKRVHESLFKAQVVNVAHEALALSQVILLADALHKIKKLLPAPAADYDPADAALPVIHEGRRRHLPSVVNKPLGRALSFSLSGDGSRFYVEGHEVDAVADALTASHAGSLRDRVKIIKREILRRMDADQVLAAVFSRNGYLSHGLPPCVIRPSRRRLP